MKKNTVLIWSGAAAVGIATGIGLGVLIDQDAPLLDTGSPEEVGQCLEKYPFMSSSSDIALQACGDLGISDPGCYYDSGEGLWLQDSGAHEYYTCQKIVQPWPNNIDTDTCYEQLRCWNAATMGNKEGGN